METSSNPQENSALDKKTIKEYFCPKNHKLNEVVQYSIGAKLKSGKDIVIYCDICENVINMKKGVLREGAFPMHCESCDMDICQKCIKNLKTTEIITED